MDSQKELWLEIRSLGYSYGARQAVRDATFSVKRGEVLGLLGANGAGKTTILSCISGLFPNWTGSILLDSRPFLPAVDANARSCLGIVPQELAIYENLTARENLELFAKLFGVPKSSRADRIQTMLEFAGLEARGNDRVKTFSGGMKRRLNLAIGLVHSPSLLLLDEPTVGVDPQSRNHLFDAILRLKESGLSMIYTTHYMEEAERLCDRIAIVDEGSIKAMGTSLELAQQTGDENANLESVFLQLTGRSLRDE